MKYFDFQTPVIKWVEFYLSKSKFLVCIENALSEAGTLKYGGLQGCILGFSGFPLYVNDLLE